MLGIELGTESMKEGMTKTLWKEDNLLGPMNSQPGTELGTRRLIEENMGRDSELRQHVHKHVCLLRLSVCLAIFKFIYKGRRGKRGKERRQASERERHREPPSIHLQLGGSQNQEPEI